MAGLPRKNALVSPENDDSFPLRAPVALVHDWLLGMRGGEWVLDALVRMLPLAQIHTLFYRPEPLAGLINRAPIHPSRLSRLPGAARYYRWLLPLLPAAIERLRIDPACRLVLSISHCVAHGVRPPAGACHVNYCLSPMRYLYDQGEAYRGTGGGLGGWALERAAPALARWDRAAARRPDRIWAISHFVARRIERVWGVPVERVIYPPVRTGRFTPPPPGPPRRREYLLVSAMVPYKRVELAVEAAGRLGIPLRVVGGGPLLGRVRRMARSCVTVEGPVGEERLAWLYRTRRGLIFPGEEDFGIIPLEAMASGMPVLGLGAGGLCETLAEGIGGAFFAEPTVEALADAWRAFEPEAYPPEAIRAHAERFGEARFMQEVAQALEALAIR